MGIPLNFTPASTSESVLLKDAPASILQALGETKMTANLHAAGVPPSAMRLDPKLRKFWRILATNLDRSGKEFVSLAESTELPFFASQFHPEKNSYEHHQKYEASTPEAFHSSEAGEAVAFLARFFVDQARKNDRTFA